MSDNASPPVAGLDFIACGPQETITHTFPDTQGDLTGTTGSGLINLGGFPRELRGSVPEHWVPALRPIIAAISYCGLPGNRHQLELSLVGRRLDDNPADIPPNDWRSKICLHALDPANLVSLFFGFNIPVPVDTEAGNGNPFALQIKTVGRTASSIVTVNYQWGMLDLSSRTHVGTS